MLILTRTVGETVVIGGGLVVVTVTEIRSGQVKIGFQAARDLSIHRGEIQERIEREKAASAAR